MTSSTERSFAPAHPVGIGQRNFFARPQSARNPIPAKFNGVGVSNNTTHNSKGKESIEIAGGQVREPSLPFILFCFYVLE